MNQQYSQLGMQNRVVEPPKPNTLSNLISELKEDFKFVEEQYRHSCEIRSSLVGNWPQSDKPEGPSAIPTGHIDELYQLKRQLRELTLKLRDNLEAIHAAL